MVQYQLELIYSLYPDDNELKTLTCLESYENEDLVLVINETSLETSLEMKEASIKSVELHPKKEIKIQSVRLVGNVQVQKNTAIFMNGFQSWTDSQEVKLTAKVRGISRFAKILIRKYELDRYGDYSFVKYSRKKGRLHGFTYGYLRELSNLTFFGSLNERDGYTVFKLNTKTQTLSIEKDIEGLIYSKKTQLFKLLFINSNEIDVFDTYFNAMNIEPPHVAKMTGWTSWYNYYENINENIILENVNAFQATVEPIDIFQIDDGYERAVGDWLSIKSDEFPNGMKYLADKIHENGYKAGIWLAPFVCETNSELFNNKKEWLLRDAKGELVCGGGNWSKFYALDIYHPEVQAYLKHVFHVVLNQWGYDMVKLDFLYAISLIPYKNKSRGQIMCDGMDLLREWVGDKMILGCGVPLGPAFGKVDYCRIGCDMGLDWNGSALMQLLHRERVSTYHSMMNAIYRRQLNKRAFMNDPDVFLLRDTQIKMTRDQRDLLATVNHYFGSLIFTSDKVSDYTENVFQAFTHYMKKDEINIRSVDLIKKDILCVVVEDQTQRSSVHKKLILNFTKKKYLYHGNMIKPYSYFLEN